MSCPCSLIYRPSGFVNVRAQFFTTVDSVDCNTLANAMYTHHLRAIAKKPSHEREGKSKYTFAPKKDMIDRKTLVSPPSPSETHVMPWYIILRLETLLRNGADDQTDHYRHELIQLFSFSLHRNCSFSLLRDGGDWVLEWSQVLWVLSCFMGTETCLFVYGDEVRIVSLLGGGGGKEMIACMIGVDVCSGCKWGLYRCACFAFAWGLCTTCDVTLIRLLYGK